MPFSALPQSLRNLRLALSRHNITTHNPQPGALTKRVERCGITGAEMDPPKESIKTARQTLENA